MKYLPILVILITANLFQLGYCLTIEDAVLLALRNNPQVHAAREGVKQAEADLWLATSAFLPTVTLSRTYTAYDEEQSFSLSEMMPPTPSNGNNSNPKSSRYYQDDQTEPAASDKIIIQPKTIGTYGMTIDQPIFNGGAIWLGRSMAVIGKETKEVEYDKTLQEVAHSTMSAYLDLWEANEMYRVAEEALNSMTEHYKVVRKMHEVGIVPKSDLLRMEAELASVQQSVDAAHNGVNITLAALNFLIGREQDSPVEISEATNISPPIYLLNESLKHATTNRLDLKSLELALEVSRKTVAMSASSLLPSLNLQVSYSRLDEAVGFSADRDSWSYTLVASYILPLGLGNIAGVQSSKAQLRSLSRQHELAIKGAEFEVRTAFMLMKQAQSAIEPAEKQEIAAQENMHLVESRYNEGAASQVEYLDARLALTQAEINLVQTRIKLIRNIIDLQKAMGMIPIPANIDTN